MSVRAVFLAVLNFVLPGSAQLVAGSRVLGRIGLWATGLLVVTAAALVTLWLVAPDVVFAWATAPWVLWIVQLAAYGYAGIWIVLTIDTLRLMRLIRVGPLARILVPLLALTGALLPGLGAVWVAGQAASARGLFESVFSHGQVLPPSDGRYHILLLGGDSGADRYGLRPDSISVVSIAADGGDAVVIGIPRNQEQVPFSDGSPLWGPFPDGYDCGDECLVSYLYTYASEHPELYPHVKRTGNTAGMAATRDAVEGITGLDIQYTVLIDMASFEDLVDALGGIDIRVKQRLPVGGHVDEVTGELVGVDYWLEPGRQHLDGHDALWYGRSRATTSDYDRMARQKQVQQAVLDTIEPGVLLEHFTELAAVGTTLVKTDIPAAMLPTMLRLALSVRDGKITELDLVPPDYNPAFPDYDRVHADIQAAFVKAAARTAT